MRVLLVDDEPFALRRLEALLQPMADLQVVGTAQDGEVAAELISRLHPDMVFLDIRMPGRSGVALAQSLRGGVDTEIVFVTAYDHFAAEAFNLDAVDYLLKPVAADRLALTVARARRRRAGGSALSITAASEETTASDAAGSPYVSSLWVRRKEGLVRVEVPTIEWIEAAGDYVVLHTQTRSHMLRMTMDGLQKRLDPNVMIRVSRSAFVRRSAVKSVERATGGGLVMTLSDETAIQVSRTYFRQVGAMFGVFRRGALRD